jgi:hypothetical protein
MIENSGNLTTLYIYIGFKGMVSQNLKPRPGNEFPTWARSQAAIDAFI